MGIDVQNIRLSSPVEIAGVRFANRLMNGAYIGSKTLADARLLAGSACGAVVVGSISLQPRRVNPGRGYWRHRQGIYALNSYGMPNGGLPYFTKHLPYMVRLAHLQGKPLIANLIGFAPHEFVELVAFAEACGVDMVELNFGCPNVWDGGRQKAILSYDAAQTKRTLALIAASKPIVPVTVKISPLPPHTLVEIAQVIAKSPIVRAVTATNSYPNASLSAGTRFDDEEALAGLTGRALKPISLGVVKQLRGLLPDDIDIIGCGGISSIRDVRDYLAAGAKAVQLATALVENGTAVFEQLLQPAPADRGLTGLGTGSHMPLR